MNRGDGSATPLSGAGSPQQLASIRENAPMTSDAASSSSSPPPPLPLPLPAAAARIIGMARHLGIDAAEEFYLLPLAQQALALAPPAAAGGHDGAGAGAGTLGQPELQWFRERVQEERRQFHQAPGENSPWLLISDDPAATAGAGASGGASRPISAASAGPISVPHSYYFNFETRCRAPAEQAQLADDLLSLEPPLAFFNDGVFVSGDAALAADGAGGAGGGGSSRPGALSYPRGARPSGRGGGGGGGALPELDAMRFTSWFVEHGVKRYVRVVFWMVAEEFEVHILAPGVGALPTASSVAAAAGSAPGAGAGAMAGSSGSGGGCGGVASVDDTTRVYRLKSVRSKHGPAGCWDLHLQATLTIFGRPTTLLQCDSPTRAWVEGGARRLLRVRELLSARLARYQRTPEPRQSRVPLVEVHLRALMRDVADLKNQLAKHRPGIAERYEL